MEFGIDGHNSLITNTLACRPDNNKFPKDDNLVINCVNKWLINEIMLTNPKLILLIGSTPTKFVLSKSGITKIRGNIFEFKENHPEAAINPLCIPTLHPSYVNRKLYGKEGKAILEAFRDDIRKTAIMAGVCECSPSLKA